MRPLRHALVIVPFLALGCSSSTSTSAPTPTTTVLSSGANPSVAGQSVDLTATISGGSGGNTGTVSFADSGVTLAGCAAQPVTAGQASCTFSAAFPGTHPLGATYHGDPSSEASVATVVVQVVHSASTTTTITLASPQANPGGPITLSGIVSVNAPGAGSPQGNVAFISGGNLIASCALAPLNAQMGCQASATLAPGSRTITASFPGDANFFTSVSAGLQVVVN
ncbi:MAG: Ig-like domain-containing protein [Gemmatimonadota bacterium]